ncbi:hypothetical protein U9M48_039600 [Paspalum notatum var. saurae]|uniref:Reverse transcriptase domain-containing protein n=1 Tax=Paspalum notatum var. saurae TaxID=547442 RepID=A0AAQ3UNU8_PASNO
MPMDKAPGPDGFTGRFYKCCWGIIGADVLLALNAIHRGHVFKFRLLNSAFITLIPKKHLGFGRKWCNLISLLLSTSSTQVLINRREQGDPLSPMLFILVMDVLNSLIAEASQRNLLQPIHGSHNPHHISLYADDAVLFVRPSSGDLSATTPIQCSEEDIALISEELSFVVGSFPCTYLGLLLTLHKPPKSVLLPLVDKVAGKLPGWKAPLLNRAGRLVVVKSVLTTTLIHLMTAMDLPKWMIRAIDKLRRSFLWKVQRPLRFGGLGVLDLERMGWALRIRWLWFQKTGSTRTWTGLQVMVPKKASALFAAAVDTIVGNGRSTKFWTDRWVQGKTLAELAPNLFNTIPKKTVQRRTVSQALDNRRWVSDIKGALTVQVLSEYLLVWDLVDGVELQLDTPDQHLWKLSSSGVYSCKSAYDSMFTGTISFSPWKRIWKSWARMNCRFFI